LASASTKEKLMSDHASYSELSQWENALTIHVGDVHKCDECGNVVMVTRGGVGVLELNCCGKPMQLVAKPDREGQ
jgi:desulfoferrodoxin-like iron-binding protein